MNVSNAQVTCVKSRAAMYNVLTKAILVLC